MAGSSSAPAFEPVPSGREPIDGLQALRRELFELAFDLERKGRADAADLATSIARRIEEILGSSPGDEAGLEPAAAVDDAPLAR
ncbi:MAG TPA: hypothetical protein VGD81_19275 [Opitutaceae bacterium]